MEPAAQPTAQETVPDAVETVPETEPETEAKPELPEKDYEGYSFRIMGSHEKDLKYMLASESTGEVLNDAIYDANAKVMEAFNIRFEDIEIDNRAIAQIGKMIKAGGDDLDLAYMHNCDTAQNALQGWFLDINGLQYVNTRAEWWPQNTVESLTLNNKMYYYSNYSSYEASYGTRVLFFNKALLHDNNLENPYELVWNGKWTLDKAAEMTKDLYVDENGDGIRGMEDTYGVAAAYYPYCWAESFGIEMYIKTPGSSELSLTDNNEHIITVIDKLHNWLFNGNPGTWIEFDMNRPDARGIFQESRAMFIFDIVGDLTTSLMDTDIDFGIVPYPKSDEQQEKFYCGTGDGLITAPVTTADPERTGIIIEAMAYEGYRKIMPAYIETTLKSRYATDDECTKMLELIFKNQVLSFSYLFANAVPNGMQFRIIYETVPDNNYATWYAQNEKKELRFMERLTDFYR